MLLGMKWAVACFYLYFRKIILATVGRGKGDYFNSQGEQKWGLVKENIY